MDILLAAEEFPAVSETFVINQIIGLRRLGVGVSVIADQPRAEAIIHEDVLTHGLLDVVDYAGGRQPAGAKLTQLTRLVARSTATGDLPALREIGQALLDQAHRGGWHASIGRLMRYRERLKERLDGFDAVLCNFGQTGELITRVRAALGLTVPVATIFHGYDATSYVKRCGRDVYRRQFRRGDLFLVVSEVMRQHLIGLGCPEDRLLVQRMGVDCRRLRYGYQGGPEHGPFTFLSVGRLVEKKGTAVMLHALRRCREAVPDRDVRLLLIGDGPLHGTLKRLAADLGVDGAVHFAGAQEHSAVIAATQAADGFLCPSVTAADGDCEGVPVALQEAMAFGLPVLATSHGGIPELVRDRQSGLLVPERDPAALAAGMAALVTDGALRRNLSRGGRDTVERDFDLDRWNAVLAERLAALAAARPRHLRACPQAA